MTSHGGEAEDLSKLAPVALVINIGTMNPDGIRDCLQAVRAYNTQGNPVLFDPVGAGATEFRRNTVKALMTGGHFDVIKGNEREIMTLWGEDGAKQRGVDSDGNNLSDTEKARLVKMLAAREGKGKITRGKKLTEIGRGGDCDDRSHGLRERSRENICYKYALPIEISLKDVRLIRHLGRQRP